MGTEKQNSWKKVMKKLDNIKYEYKKHLFSNKILYIFTKWCNESDLNSYTSKYILSEIDWKIILFKIIYTLAVIHNYYPNFRHNDLSSKNILVNVINKRNTADQYSINGSTYSIPDNGIEIYLWDFEYANIDGLTKNPLISENEFITDEYGIRLTGNKYYDIHYFLNSLYNIKYTKLPEKIKSFIERNIKKEHLAETNKLIKNYRLIEDVETNTPIKMLSDSLFVDFKHKYDNFSARSILCCGINSVSNNQTRYYHGDIV